MNLSLIPGSLTKPGSYLPPPEFGRVKTVDLVALLGRQYIAVEIIRGRSDSPVNVSRSPETNFARIKVAAAEKDAEAGMRRVLGES